MTKEEAGKLYTAGILLSKPGEGIDCSIKLFRELIFNAFISGVEWSEKQGVTYKDVVFRNVDDEGDVVEEWLCLDGNGEKQALMEGNFKPMDKVIVQIKKIDLEN